MGSPGRCQGENFQRWLALRDRLLALLLSGIGGSGAAGSGRRLMSFRPRVLRIQERTQVQRSPGQEVTAEPAIGGDLEESQRALYTKTT